MWVISFTKLALLLNCFIFLQILFLNFQSKYFLFMGDIYFGNSSIHQLINNMFGREEKKGPRYEVAGNLHRPAHFDLLDRFNREQQNQSLSTMYKQTLLSIYKNTHKRKYLYHNGPMQLVAIEKFYDQISNKVRLHSILQTNFWDQLSRYITNLQKQNKQAKENHHDISKYESLKSILWDLVRSQNQRVEGSSEPEKEDLVEALKTLISRNKCRLHYFLNSKVIQSAEDQLFLSKSFEKYLGQNDPHFKEVYKFDENNPTILKKYLSGVNNTITLIKLLDGRVLGIYSSLSHCQKINSEVNAFVVDFANKECYPILEGKKPLICDPKKLIFGNEQISIDKDRKCLNIHQKDSVFNVDWSKILGEKEKVGIQTFEIYQVHFPYSSTSRNIEKCSKITPTLFYPFSEFTNTFDFFSKELKKLNLKGETFKNIQEQMTFYLEKITRESSTRKKYLQQLEQKIQERKLLEGLYQEKQIDQKDLFYQKIPNRNAYFEGENFMEQLNKQQESSKTLDELKQQIKKKERKIMEFQQFILQKQVKIKNMTSELKNYQAIAEQLGRKFKEQEEREIKLNKKQEELNRLYENIKQITLNQKNENLCKDGNISISRMQSFFLKGQIEKISSHLLKGSNLLYSFPKQKQKNFHSAVDRHSNYIVVILLKNQWKIAAFSQQMLQEQMSGNKGQGFLASLTNKEAFYLKNIQKMQLTTYNEEFLIFGKEELVVDFSRFKVKSFFGPREENSFNNQYKNQKVLFGRQENEAQIVCCEVFQLYF